MKKNVACTLEKGEFGRVFRCHDHRMCDCAYFEPDQEDSHVMDASVMCKYNLDPAAESGTPEEVTDFCFNSEARKIASRDQIIKE